MASSPRSDPKTCPDDGGGRQRRSGALLHPPVSVTAAAGADIDAVTVNNEELQRLINERSGRPNPSSVNEDDAERTTIRVERPAHHTAATIGRGFGDDRRSGIDRYARAARR